MLKLKRDLKSEKTETVEYIKEYFAEMWDNMKCGITWTYLGYPINWDTSQTL